MNPGTFQAANLAFERSGGVHAVEIGALGVVPNDKLIPGAIVLWIPPSSLQVL